MKYCKDCKWMIIAQNTNNPVCAHPKADNDINPVTGNNTYSSCEGHRFGGPFLNWLFNDCGQQGKWFEPKETNL